MPSEITFLEWASLDLCAYFPWLCRMICSIAGNFLRRVWIDKIVSAVHGFGCWFLFSTYIIAYTLLGHVCVFTCLCQKNCVRHVGLTTPTDWGTRTGTITDLSFAISRIFFITPESRENKIKVTVKTDRKS